ncbi:hypothetical protein F5I97DRAFT_643065 [Phlebopus sp. FC_14]|nr:hypothetical protein F5I97DRAFT_643065 [Phlebopus sp. FC_14]
MRLVLSSSNYLNMDLSDGQGHKIYTVSTPRPIDKKRVTTVTKHAPDAGSGADKIVGTIEWHKAKVTMVQVHGKAFASDKMFTQRQWSSWRHFTAPDGRSYKWTVENNHYRLQHEFSDAKLASFHKRRFAFMTQRFRPPSYLEVAVSAEHMMDHVLITFLYVQSLPQERRREQKTVRKPNPRRTREDRTSMQMDQMNQMMMMMMQVTEMMLESQMVQNSTPPMSPTPCVC